LNELGIRWSTTGVEQRQCRSVLMVGTEIGGKGGIGSVVHNYKTARLFEMFSVTYVPTHREGRAVNKAIAALRGWCLVLYFLIRLDAPLVHIHMASRKSFWRKYVVCLLARLFRRPYVLHIHGGQFIEFFTQECSPAVQRVVRYVLQDAAYILALSEQWKSQFLAICPGSTVEVLPNTVILPDVASRPQQPHGCPKIILFMGKVVQRKGAHDLISAFAQIAASYTGARLICAGDGDLDPFRKLATDLCIADRVEFPGWLDLEQCRENYKLASIFALPSYAEGLPISLLEAMSWQLPVVSCPVGGIPELIQDGENGLLVNPGDVEALAKALSRLLSDEDLRTRVARTARYTIEDRFSLEANLERLGRLYLSFGLKPVLIDSKC